MGGYRMCGDPDDGTPSDDKTITEDVEHSGAAHFDHWTDVPPAIPGLWFAFDGKETVLLSVFERDNVWLAEEMEPGRLPFTHRIPDSRGWVWMGPLKRPKCVSGLHPLSPEPTRPSEEDMMSKPEPGMVTVRQLAETVSKLNADMAGLATQLATLRGRIHACEQQRATSMAWDPASVCWETVKEIPAVVDWLPGKATEAGFYWYEDEPGKVRTLFLFQGDIDAGWGSDEQDSLPGRWAGPLPAPPGYTPTGKKIEENHA